MLVQTALGLVMTAAVIAFGAITLVACAEPLRKSGEKFFGHTSAIRHIATLTVVATSLVMSMLFVALFWALFLLALGVFGTFEAALYFSMISFSTVGYGDVVPPEDWRILAAFVAIDGFVLFGLNTAFIFEVLRRMRENVTSTKSPVYDEHDRNF